MQESYCGTVLSMADQNGPCFHANSMLVKIEIENCFKMSDVCCNLSRWLPDIEI